MQQNYQNNTVLNTEFSDIKKLTMSSKKKERTLIFSMAMGANYSFELIPLETYASQFIGHNNFFLGSLDNLLFTILIFVQLIRGQVSR